MKKSRYIIGGILCLAVASASYFGFKSLNNSNQVTSISNQNNAGSAENTNEKSQIQREETNKFNLISKNDPPSKTTREVSPKNLSLKEANISFEINRLNDTIAPSYVHGSQIYSEIQESTDGKEGTSYILSFNKDSKEIKKIYDSPNKHTIISSLVGIKGTLYWIEHDRARDQKKDVKWRIVSMDLKNNQVKEISKGIAQDEINPPVLRTCNDKLTWIEKEINDGIVNSNVFIKESNAEKRKLFTAELNEKEKDDRDGVFLDLQRPTEEGLLIQEVVFEPKQQKTYRLSFYPYSGESPRALLEGDYPDDYTASKEWFVWTKSGEIFVYSLKEGKMIFSTKERSSTADSPFIVNQTLYYRESMSTVHALNLENGDKSIVHDSKKGILSKIFNFDSGIAFSEEPSLTESTSRFNVGFTILETNNTSLNN